MSTSLGAMRNTYMQNFPSEVPTKASQGFILTATISLVAGNAANTAILGGAIAATTTLIEAVTRPITRSIFPQHPLIGMFIQILIPKTMALGLAASLAPCIGLSYRVTSFVLPVIAWLTLNEGDGFYNKNLGMVEVL